MRFLFSSVIQETLTFPRCFFIILFKKIGLAILPFFVIINGSPIAEESENYPYTINQINKCISTDQQDFYQLLDRDTIVGLATIFYLKDDQFKETVHYVKSEEYQKLIKNTLWTNEYLEMISYLLPSSPANCSVNINMINSFKIIYSNSLSKCTENLGGYSGFLSELRSRLPMENIKAMYNEKMKNSPVFAGFVQRIRSYRFRGLLRKFLENTTAKKLIAETEAHGYNLKEVAELNLAINGIENFY